MEGAELAASTTGHSTIVHPLKELDRHNDGKVDNCNPCFEFGILEDSVEGKPQGMGLGRGTLDFATGIKVNLHLIKGDIIDLTNTDSIVNFVYDEDIYGRMGIMQAAGDAVKEEYNKQRLQEDLPHVHYGVVKTTAGNLPYFAIFHIQVFEQLAKFENTIYKALQLADRSGMRSIAFPALASREHVNSYLKIFYEFEKRALPTCLHMIDIVANNQTDYDYHDMEIGKCGENLFK